MLRVAQGLAVFYGIASLAFPVLRAEQFMNAGLTTVAARMGPELFLFGVPLALSLLLGTLAGLLMLRRRPDRAEAQRAIGFVIGAPFMASGIVLPPELAPVVTSVGVFRPSRFRDEAEINRPAKPADSVENDPPPPRLW